MKRKVVALAVICTAFFLAGPIGASAKDRPDCNAKCEWKKDRTALRKKVDRSPIDSYIVACESGGSYSALNPSSYAGGKYQIIPSTWHSYLNYVKQRVWRLAEDRPRADSPPSYAHQATPLLQDIVAAKIWKYGGSSQWDCA